MKVLFLQPIVAAEKLWGKYAVEGGKIPPIGILSIAAYLENKGHQVKIIDCLVENYGAKELESFLRQNIFDVIGISAFTNTIADTYHTVEICKAVAPGVKIVVGGVHATILPKRTMEECKEIDFLVQGEGEMIMDELLQYLETGVPSIHDIGGLSYRNDGGEIKINERRALILNLDELPMPAYHLLDVSKYMPHPTQYKSLPSFPVIFQRGCPFQCSFCGASSVHGRMVRHKSVAYLIREIEILIKNYGARGIHFQDSTFTINKEYVKQFCEEILKLGLKFDWDINSRVDCLDEDLLRLMKKAGLWMINFGLESGNQESLDLLNKKTNLAQIRNAIEITRAAGIVTFSTWILGIPGEDEKMVRSTIGFAKEIGTEMALFFLPVPYPGTELVNICRRIGGLREDAKWEDYSSVDFAHPVYVNPFLGKEKMQFFLKEAFLSYYLSPKIWWRNIKVIHSFEDIKRYWRGFRAFANGWLK